MCPEPVEFQWSYVLQAVPGIAERVEGGRSHSLSNEDGMDLHELQAHLRHVSVHSTARYSRHVRFQAKLQKVPAPSAHWSELTETMLTTHSWNRCTVPPHPCRTWTLIESNEECRTLQTKRLCVMDSCLPKSGPGSASSPKRQTCENMLVPRGSLSKCCPIQVNRPGNERLWVGSHPDSCVVCSSCSREGHWYLACPFCCGSCDPRCKFVVPVLWWCLTHPAQAYASAVHILAETCPHKWLASASGPLIFSFGAGVAPTSSVPMRSKKQTHRARQPPFVRFGDVVANNIARHLRDACERLTSNDTTAWMKPLSVKLCKSVRAHWRGAPCRARPQTRRCWRSVLYSHLNLCGRPT